MLPCEMLRRLIRASLHARSARLGVAGPVDDYYSGPVQHLQARRMRGHVVEALDDRRVVLKLLALTRRAHTLSALRLPTPWPGVAVVAAGQHVVRVGRELGQEDDPAFILFSRRKRSVSL